MCSSDLVEHHGVARADVLGLVGRLESVWPGGSADGRPRVDVRWFCDTYRRDGFMGADRFAARCHPHVVD